MSNVADIEKQSKRAMPDKRIGAEPLCVDLNDKLSDKLSDESKLSADSAMMVAVIAGPQAGATVELLTPFSVRVGAGVDDDIVLRDAALQDTCIQLSSNADNAISLLVIDGEFVHNEQSIAVNGSVEIPLYEPICIGSSVLQLGLPGEIHLLKKLHQNPIINDEQRGASVTHNNTLNRAGAKPASLNLNDSLADRDGDDGVPATTNVNRISIGSASKPIASNKKFTAWTTALAIGMLAMGVGALWQWQKSVAPTVAATPFSLEQQLADSAYSSLTVNREENKVSISGYVRTVDEQRGLSDWLGALPVNVENRVYADETIADQISNVLRVNDIDAELDVQGEGRFVVRSTLSAGALLDRLEIMIKEDVPQVAALNIDNTLPSTGLVAKVKDEMVLDEGKRVSLVVSDDPSYIVTEDGSRYFTGSILPTGHRVKSIIDGRVLVEKNGASTVLKF